MAELDFVTPMQIFAASNQFDEGGRVVTVRGSTYPRCGSAVCTMPQATAWTACPRRACQPVWIWPFGLWARFTAPTMPALCAKFCSTMLPAVYSRSVGARKTERLTDEKNGAAL